MIRDMDMIFRAIVVVWWLLLKTFQQGSLDNFTVITWLAQHVSPAYVFAIGHPRPVIAGLWIGLNDTLELYCVANIGRYVLIE